MYLCIIRITPALFILMWKSTWNKIHIMVGHHLSFWPLRKHSWLRNLYHSFLASKNCLVVAEGSFPISIENNQFRWPKHAGFMPVGLGAGQWEKLLFVFFQRGGRHISLASGGGKWETQTSAEWEVDENSCGYLSHLRYFFARVNLHFPKCSLASAYAGGAWLDGPFFCPMRHSFFREQEGAGMGRIVSLSFFLIPCQVAGWSVFDSIIYCFGGWGKRKSMRIKLLASRPKKQIAPPFLPTPESSPSHATSSRNYVLVGRLKKMPAVWFSFWRSLFQVAKKTILELLFLEMRHCKSNVSSWWRSLTPPIGKLRGNFHNYGCFCFLSNWCGHPPMKAQQAPCKNLHRKHVERVSLQCVIAVFRFGFTAPGRRLWTRETYETLLFFF